MRYINFKDGKWFERRDHAILLEGEEVWKYFTKPDMSALPFDRWLSIEVEDWLVENVTNPRLFNIPFAPRYKGYSFSRPCYKAIHQFGNTFTVKDRDFLPEAYIYFANKNDAMKFKLVWA